MITEQFPISEIVRDHSLQIRSQIIPAAVQRYRECLDELPPITLFECEIEEQKNLDGEILRPAGRGYLLADGFHRLLANQGEGRSTISAEIRQGTHDDARRFAAIANSKSGQPLTRDERAMAIHSLAHLGVSNAQIARDLSLSAASVSRVISTFKARQQLHSAGVDVSSLSDAHMSEVVRFEGEGRLTFANACLLNGWTRAQVRTAAANLGDSGVSQEDKRAIIAGELEPINILKNGEQIRVRTASPDEEKWEALKQSIDWLTSQSREDLNHEQTNMVETFRNWIERGSQASQR